MKIYRWAVARVDVDNVTTFLYILAKDKPDAWEIAREISKDNVLGDKRFMRLITEVHSSQDIEYFVDNYNPYDDVLCSNSVLSKLFPQTMDSYKNIEYKHCVNNLKSTLLGSYDFDAYN